DVAAPTCPARAARRPSTCATTRTCRAPSRTARRTTARASTGRHDRRAPGGRPREPSRTCRARRTPRRALAGPLRPPRHGSAGPCLRRSAVAYLEACRARGADGERTRWQQNRLDTLRSGNTTLRCLDDPVTLITAVGGQGGLR